MINKLKAIVGLLCFSTVSISSFAASNKVYSPMGCHPAYPTQINVMDLNGNGSVKNIDKKKELHVLCPIVRDTHSSFITKFILNYKDNHADENIRCSIRSIVYGTIEPKIKKISFATKGNHNEWERLVVNSDLVSTTLNDTYHLYCILPPSTEIGSYQVVEG